MIHKVFIVACVAGHLATMSLEPLMGMWIRDETYRTMGLIKALLNYKDGSLRMLVLNHMLPVTPCYSGKTTWQMTK